ncbi:MAG: hypothetical protein IJ811_01750 [Clostridia bacterium]|nr:hypothetical protein [Clostridia bacterium]
MLLAANAWKQTFIKDMTADNDKNKVKKPEKPNQTVKREKPKQNKAHEDFKRRYFEFYDDVKTSDRQDW